MTRTPTTLLFAWLLSVGPALAGDDCAVPMTDWQPRDAVLRLAAAQGWQVRRIKIDDGCYELIGRDADGRAIEVKLDPATLGVVEMEFESRQDDDDDTTEHE